MSNLLEIELNYMEYSHFSVHNLEKNRSLNRRIHKLCIFLHLDTSQGPYKSGSL